MLPNIQKTLLPGGERRGYESEEKMKRALLGMVAFTISLMARNAEGVPLFAEVVSLKENETLGIHENAGYESEKRGELHLGERVMVDICVNSLSLKWCRVKSEDEADGAREGWVNSRYLDFHNNGYVGSWATKGDVSIRSAVSGKMVGSCAKLSTIPAKRVKGPTI
jgi:hypothetical protein